MRQYLRGLGLADYQIARVIAQLDQRGSAEVDLEGRPKVGPRIVRAWFDTIINPLVDALVGESVLLTSRDWTWRFRPAGLESIREVRQYLGHRTWANLEQLCELYPDLETQILQHDESVAELERAVYRLYDALVKDGGFVALCHSLLAPESLAQIGVGSPTDLFGAYPSEDWLKLLAQYTVNNTMLLGSHNSTSKLWNPHGARFRASLESPAMAPWYAEATAAVTKLQKTDSELVQSLKGLRRELSLDYDEPYVLAGQN